MSENYAIIIKEWLVSIDCIVIDCIVVTGHVVITCNNPFIDIIINGCDIEVLSFCDITLRTSETISMDLNDPAVFDKLHKLIIRKRGIC